MKKIFCILIFSAHFSYAKEVCVIDPGTDSSFIIAGCTETQDTVVNSDQALRGERIAKIIKALLEKGYELKSENVFVKY